MDKLIFKGFTWPQNPEYFRQKFVREPNYVKVEDGEPVFSGMGPLKRTITGSGAFMGENAYTEFKKLIALCDAKEAGILKHPVWGDVNAYLLELEMAQEPRADYVAYSFTFREADTDGAIPK
jgi:hypothetical protein